MCGHVGLAGKLNAKDEVMMKRLLVLDVFRGPDSTGFASMNGSTRDVKIAKVPSHPFDLFEMPKFKSALSGYSSSVFLGHNRLATKGGVNTYNAHPYEFGDVVGAHNGTLAQPTWTKIEQALDEKYPVDSMAVVAALDELGVEKTISMMREVEYEKKKVKMTADGVTTEQEIDVARSCPDAYALVWINKKENTLNFIRNRERPMWYAFSEDFSRLIWASEWEIIDHAHRSAYVATGGIDWKLHVSDTGFRFFRMPEDTHFKFDLDKLRKGEWKDLPKPTAKVIKGKESTPTYTTYNGYSPFRETGTGTTCGVTTPGLRQEKSTSQTSRGATTSGSTESSSGNIIRLFGDAQSPLGGVISEDRFDAIAKYGCSYCGETVEYTTPGIVIWDRDDVVLCKECAESSGMTKGSRVYLRDVANLK